MKSQGEKLWLKAERKRNNPVNKFIISNYFLPLSLLCNRSGEIHLVATNLLDPNIIINSA